MATYRRCPIGEVRATTITTTTHLLCLSVIYGEAVKAFLDNLFVSNILETFRERLEWR